MREALAKAIEIQKRSGERIAISGEPGVPATIALLGFRTSVPSAQPKAC